MFKKLEEELNRLRDIKDIKKKNPNQTSRDKNYA